MSLLRVGIIGCGRIFPKHLQAWELLKAEGEIVALCDSDPKKAELAQGKLRHAKIYLDMQQMLQNEKLDVVSILTPSGNHAAVALQCAGKVPNLIVEKPMALRLVDADALIEACDRLGTRLFVVKQNRYNPPVMALRSALTAGRFGKLVMGTVRVRWCRRPEYYQQDPWRGTWAHDGGVFTNQASHHIDLLTWMMGSVESVYCKTGTFLSPIETEDTGVAVLKFTSGALGVIEATTCTRPKDLEGSISILGEKGSVEISGFAVNRMRHWNFEETIAEDEASKTLGWDPPDVYGFGHNAFMREVVECIRQSRRSMIDGLEARKSLELIHALYESVETRKEVKMAFSPRLCRLGEL